MIKIIIAAALALSACGVDPGEQIDDGLDPISVSPRPNGCRFIPDCTCVCDAGACHEVCGTDAGTP